MPYETEQFDTPVLFIVFNRPAETAAAFERIRARKPARLFIAADGPRPDAPDDTRRCLETRQITERIDWPCRAERLYYDENLGCGRGPATAIDWFFERVDEGIILEDDCVADASFFAFCRELLERYRAERRVMLVSGDDFMGGKRAGEASFFFSRYPLTWGWATWKRVWKEYDFEMRSFAEPAAREAAMKGLTAAERRYWLSVFGHSAGGKKPDAWDYQLTYAIWKEGGLCAAPNGNLVANIGFSDEATHTTDPSHPAARVAVSPMSFPLAYPRKIAASPRTDRRLFRRHFLKKKSLSARIWSKIRRSLAE